MNPPKDKRKRPPVVSPAAPVVHRDCSGPLYTSCPTLSCAAANYCIPCVYKICTFDTALDRTFCTKIPNQRPENCKRISEDTPPYSQVLGYGSPSQKVLTVGDGDLSFSVALARLGSKVIATSLDRPERLQDIYGSASILDKIKELKQHRAAVAVGVDATDLKNTLPDNYKNEKFDRIVWNFPCLATKDGKDGQNEEMEQNKKLLRLFATNAVNFLKKDGQIHINHKTKPPYNQWNIEDEITHDQQLCYLGRIVLDRALFMPYVPRKALDRKSFTHHDACTYIFSLKCDDVQPSILTAGMKEVQHDPEDALQLREQPANALVRVTPKLIDSLRLRFLIMPVCIESKRGTKKRKQDTLS